MAPIAPALIAAGAALKAAAPILTVASAGLGAVSAIAGGRQQSAMMEAQADLQKKQAAQAQGASKIDTERIANEKRRMIGEQNAMYGAAGVDPASGSPLQVYAQTAREFETDVAYAGYNSAAGVANMATQSAAQRWAAKMRRSSGYLEGGTTLLGGLGRAYLR